MERFGVPGVAMGVLASGGEEISAYGVTSVENPLDVDASTLFQIGSITKTITATAMMRLVEQGRLDLDTPIRTYIHEFRVADNEASQNATPRHLLTHTSGWVGDDFTDTGNGDDAVERYVTNLAELPQITPLGALFSYCNSGFVVAGRVLEVICGKPYETVIHELVLQPLGMEHSFFSQSLIMTHRFAVGHVSPTHQGADGPTVARPWAIPHASNPAGGLVTCIPDLLRYARFVLGHGPAGVLSHDLRVQMQSPLARISNGNDQVGVAWMLREVDGARIVEHGGGTHGQTSIFKLVPDRDFALIVLTNSSRGGELITELTADVLQQRLGLVSREPELLDISPDQLQEYEGHYEAWLQSADLTQDGSRVQLQFHLKPGFPFKDTPRPPDPPPTAFAFCAPDTIVGLDEPWRKARADFVRDASGKIKWLRIGGRLARRQEASA